MANQDHIKNVVVLMLENGSFDHVLGACQRIKPAINGVFSTETPYSNEFEGVSYPQSPGAARIVIDDPKHETPHALAQLKVDKDGKPNSGFVQDYATAYPLLTIEGRSEVMKYHELGSLPAFHALAANFAVCDAWFSSVPGPTWANRLFAMTGTSLGHVDMPAGIMDLNLHWYNQTTLFDRLNEKSIEWAIYYGDVPLSLLLVHQWEPANRARHRPMTQFYKDAAAEADKFPQYVFIEPAYLDPGANDRHPPHDVLAAEGLIANVYNALRANEEIWKSTLLIVACDEHGGFFDHVETPGTIPPDWHQHGYDFKKLGARVPAILISPWVANAVISDKLDHTSLLNFLITKWKLGPLGDRAAQPTKFSEYFLEEPRDTPTTIPSVPPDIVRPGTPALKPTLSDHGASLVALSHALESMTGEDPAVIAERSRQVVSGPQSQVDAAVDRVEAFLKGGGVELLRTLE